MQTYQILRIKNIFTDASLLKLPLGSLQLVFIELQLQYYPLIEVWLCKLLSCAMPHFPQNEEK